MKRHLSIPGAAVGAAALVASSLLAATPAAHADSPDGTLVVNVVDQYGRPTSGVVETVDSTGHLQYAGTSDAPIAGSTQTFSSLPAGGYGLMSITPWSGVVCEGVSPCTPVSSPSITTPVVTVADGGVTTYTMHVTVPSITGSSALGSTLTLQIPQGLTTLASFYGSVPLGYAGTSVQQWMRGTAAIPSATGTSYTTVRADGSQAISAQLTPSLAATYIFASAGMQVSPFSTNAITMAKAVKTKTKTKVKVAKKIDAGERASVKVKVTSGAGVPDGYVTVKVGKFKTKSLLKGGTAFVTLPRLKVGKYKIVTKYTGSDAFKASKGKKVKVTVHS